MNAKKKFPDESTMSIEKLHNLDNSLRNNVGERFKIVRTHFGFSQKNFADRLAANQSTIANIELGKIYPNMVFIYRLLVEFKVNPAWLFTGNGDKFLCDGEKESNLNIEGFQLDDKYIDLIESMKDPVIEQIMFAKLMEIRLLIKK